MKPSPYIKLKHDKRFKNGNLKQDGDTIRGDFEIKTLDMPEMLNPPIVVSPELGDLLKKMESLK